MYHFPPKIQIFFKWGSKTSQGASLILYLLEALIITFYLTTFAFKFIYKYTRFLFKNNFFYMCFIAYKVLLIASCCKTFEKNCTQVHFLVHTGNIFFLQKLNGTHFRYHYYHNRIWPCKKNKRHRNRLFFYKKKGTHFMVQKQDFLFRQKIWYIFWV